MRRDVNVKSRAATSSIAQKKGSEIKYMTTTEISPVYERDEQFERAYIIAYARGLLEREARGIMNEEGYITAQRLRDELILSSRPRSAAEPTQAMESRGRSNGSHHRQSRGGPRGGGTGQWAH